jgi:hypothetical protein
MDYRPETKKERSFSHQGDCLNINTSKALDKVLKNKAWILYLTS